MPGYENNNHDSYVFLNVYVHKPNIKGEFYLSLLYNTILYRTSIKEKSLIKYCAGMDSLTNLSSCFLFVFICVHSGRWMKLQSNLSWLYLRLTAFSYLRQVNRRATFNICFSLFVIKSLIILYSESLGIPSQFFIIAWSLSMVFLNNIILFPGIES